MDRAFVRRHLNACAIVVFMIVYTSIVLCRPAFMYNKDGSLREFGVGTSRKTVVPAWLVAIVVGIGAYFAVTYYVAVPAV
jgi:amino acid transporter